MSAAGKWLRETPGLSCDEDARRIRSLLAAAREVGARAFARADTLDVDGAYPEAEIICLHQTGLLAATLPPQLGGVSLTGVDLAQALRAIGAGSLPLGRLFEGHVNAIALVLRYGQRDQIELMARETRAGKLSGVWNTDDRSGLRLISVGAGYRLEGRKVLASGAGQIERPIITAVDELGRRLMVTPRLPIGERGDLSRWTAHGMRASATGAVDFSGITIEPGQILGDDGDYERQPDFSGGAWRFAAVHLGAMERLLDLLREHLRQTGRGADPHQAARLGEAAIAVETGRLWVERAAVTAQDTEPCEGIVAYVNLARLAIERAALDLMELVHRSVGLAGFLRPHPIERISRDLATYLRQPAPDRALTSAAAWVLDAEATAPDLWA